MCPLILGLLPLALAQESGEVASPPADLPPVSSDLLDVAATLLTPETTTERRLEAAKILAQSGDPSALGLLAAAADARAPKVQIAALRALTAAPGPEAVRLAAAALRSPAYTTEVREVAAAVLGELQLPEAAEILWVTASERAYPDEVRRAALSTLEARYPAEVVARGRPTATASLAGVALGALGNGLTGGVMLSAVGTWGQNDAASIIGGVGGGLIGLGTGGLYGVTRATTTGQGLAYASASGWGLTTSLLASNALLGPNIGEIYGYDGEALSSQEWKNRAATVRLVGALGGAAAGYAWTLRSPEPKDVLEIDGVGYLGAALGLSATTLAVGRERGCYGEYSSDPRYDCDSFVRTRRLRNVGALAGEAAGLGAGWGLSQGWDPDGPQLLMGGAIGIEAMWATAWLPAALNADERDGALSFGFHAGLASGLAIAHLVEPDASRAGLTAWGSVVGNAVGAGLPLLAGAEDGTFARVMIPVGLLGTAGGALSAPWVDPQPGDLAMLGVAVPLAAAEGIAVAVITEDQGVLSGAQSAGLALTLSGGAAAGLTALAGKVDPQVDDMLFLGSAAVWGVWYGVLTPYAFDADLDPTQRTLAAMLTGDAFLLAGGLMLPEATLGLQPRSTVVAQIGGVTGATLGALGASLTSGSGSGVARGAVIGSALGLGAGAVVTATTGVGQGQAHLLPRPHLDLPGRWSAFASPTVMEDGAAGIAAQLSVSGW